MNISEYVIQRIKNNGEIFRDNKDLFKCEIREMMQEIIMPILSNSDFFDNNSFLGGTVFRVFYGLKRYSDDLDFTMKSDQINDFSWNPYIDKFTDKFNELGLEFSGKESVDKYGNKILRISCDSLVSFLHGKGLVPDDFTKISNKNRIWIKLETNFAVNCFNDETKMYNNNPIKVLDLPSLFAGKINACLTREQTDPDTKIKERKDHGRDWYDLVNYIDMQIIPNYHFLSEKLKYKGPFKDQNETINRDWIKKQLFERMKGLNLKELNDEITSITLKENRIILNKDLLIEKINKFGMGGDEWGRGNSGSGDGISSTNNLNKKTDKKSNDVY